MNPTPWKTKNRGKLNFMNCRKLVKSGPGAISATPASAVSGKMPLSLQPRRVTQQPDAKAMHSLKQVVPTRVKEVARRAKRVVRRVKSAPFVAYRQATWRTRALPDFLVIGAGKSGTTSLHHYLRQHPQLVSAYRKEVHYFDGGLNPNVDNFAKGQSWYRAHFPLRRDISAYQKTFEASPFYIFSPVAPKRIADLVPQVKLIALLRNPVERAIAHYFDAKRRNRELLPIFEALQAEEERLRPALEQNDFKNYSFVHHSYKTRGLYYSQIKRYLAYFPTDNILVIQSEEFFGAPHQTLRRVFEFVGVDSEFVVGDLSPRNVASNRREVRPEVYDYLHNYFRTHNQALFELVGKDYGWQE